MKRGWLRYALLGSAFFVVFLIATAPAAWLALGVARMSHGVVNLNQATGSVWGGSAQLVVHNGSSVPRNLGMLSWDAQVWWLFLGRVQVELHLVNSNIDMHGRLGIAYNTVYLDAVAADINAAYAVAVYLPAALINPEGRITVRAPSIKIQQGAVTGKADLTWENAAVSLSNGKVLGDYHLTFDGQGQSVLLKIDTLKGKLRFDGQGIWRPGSGYMQVSGSAVPEEQPSEVDSLLQIMGPDMGGGRRIWKFEQNIAAEREGSGA
jgi:hypothetical protein